MPIYEYNCADCKRRVSLFYQTFSAASAAVPTCSHCSSTNLTRLVSRVFQLKGADAQLEETGHDGVVEGEPDHEEEQRQHRPAPDGACSDGENDGVRRERQRGAHSPIVVRQRSSAGGWRANGAGADEPPAPPAGATGPRGARR